MSWRDADFVLPNSQQELHLSQRRQNVSSEHDDVVASKPLPNNTMEVPENYNEKTIQG